MMNGCWYLISARSDTVAVCTCCSGLADFFIVQFPKIRSVVWFEHEVLGIQKTTEISRNLKGTQTRLQWCCMLWVLAYLEIQQMKPSSSNSAGRGITDISGAHSLSWHYFIIWANLAFLLLQTCCSPEPISAWVLSGSIWVTVVHEKTFSSLASSQTLIHYACFEVHGSRYLRQARREAKRQGCAVDAPWKCCYVM